METTKAAAVAQAGLLSDVSEYERLRIMHGPSLVRQVTVTVLGSRFEVTYYVQGQRGHVHWPLGSKVTHLGKSPACADVRPDFNRDKVQGS